MHLFSNLLLCFGTQIQLIFIYQKRSFLFLNIVDLSCSLERPNIGIIVELHKITVMLHGVQDEKESTDNRVLLCSKFPHFTGVYSYLTLICICPNCNTFEPDLVRVNHINLLGQTIELKKRKKRKRKIITYFSVLLYPNLP